MTKKTTANTAKTTKLPAKVRATSTKTADASYSGNMSLSVSLSPEQGLNRYLQEVRKFPMLERDEEFTLAKRWQQDQDPEAAERMVTSHLRLVAKIAMGYRGYGLPIGEVISEGNVGLMQAVKKFDPDKGFRLSTYAMWWIRAAIQEYVLRSWSLVKMGTTAAQKKLFLMAGTPRLTSPLAAMTVARSGKTGCKTIRTAKKRKSRIAKSMMRGWIYSKMRWLTSMIASATSS